MSKNECTEFVLKEIAVTGQLNCHGTYQALSGDSAIFDLSEVVNFSDQPYFQVMNYMRFPANTGDAEEMDLLALFIQNFELKSTDPEVVSVQYVFDERAKALSFMATLRSRLQLLAGRSILDHSCARNDKGIVDFQVYLYETEDGEYAVEIPQNSADREEFAFFMAGMNHHMGKSRIVWTGRDETAF